MKYTPNLGIPYTEAGDHTRTWEYWAAQAIAIDNQSKPTIRSLTLADGFQFMDQEGPDGAFIALARIHICGSVERTDGARISDNSLLMTLPADLAPLSTQEFVVATGQGNSGYAVCDRGGSVTLMTSGLGGTYCALSPLQWFMKSKG